MPSSRLALLLVALLASSTWADEPKPIVLFDGKTLDGWKSTDFFKPGEVKVEDGAIVIKAGTPMTGITSTRDDLLTTNYELSYEAKKVAGSDFFAAATFPVGKSHLTLVNGGWGGHITGLSSLNGADASDNETGHSVKYKLDTWYRFQIKVTDDVIRYSIDGKEARPVEIEGRSVGVRIESGPSKPLGFSSYETTGAVRNIQIRKLTDAEVAAVRKVE
jgi:hypothetical protein